MDINLNIKEDMELKLDNLNKIKPEHSPVLFLNLCTLIYSFRTITVTFKLPYPSLLIQQK